MTIALILLTAILLFLIGTSLVLFVIGPGMLLHPHRRTVDYYRKSTSLLHPSDLEIPFEEFRLKTSDGLSLGCWFIPASGKPKGTIVHLHGVSECRIVGLPLARRLHQHGYNVFLYDSRRHGESEGKFCTYGFYEKHDTSTLLTRLQSREDLQLGKIGLFGSSMGAAVAVQVAAQDNRISAVVAESGFATLRTIFDDYQRRVIKLPWHYLRNIVIVRSERLAHFKASAVSPVDAVKDVHVPIFIMHGTEDRLIKCSYSEELYRNTGQPKELWLIEGANHSNMAEIGGEEYYRRVLAFFDQAFAQQPSA
ncbi:MAG: alpha/beta fold hydrolase [Ignavibacteria bacterium]|nr:alpha/beta fold hydrolase [Ignavibacteria bacterium]